MEDEQKIQKIVHYHFNAPIGQYIEHVDNNYYGKENDNQQNMFPQLPSQERMKKAIMETMSQGLWWSSRSWAVVYRVYQMKGYMHSFAHFAREVKDWEIDTGYECNYDAIQKPISTGVYSGMPDKWEENGAQKQAVKLASSHWKYWIISQKSLKSQKRYHKVYGSVLKVLKIVLKVLIIILSSDINCRGFFLSVPSHSES